MENLAFNLLSPSQQATFRDGGWTSWDIAGVEFRLPIGLSEEEEQALSGLPPRLQAHWRHRIASSLVVKGVSILGVWFAPGDPVGVLTVPADPFAGLEAGPAGAGQEWSRGSGDGVVPGAVHAGYAEAGPMPVSRVLAKGCPDHWVWCAPVLEGGDLVRGDLRVLDGADCGATWWEKYRIEYFAVDLPAARARFNWAAYSRWVEAATGLLGRINAARITLWADVKALAAGANRLHEQKAQLVPDRPVQDEYTVGAEQCLSRVPLHDDAPVRTRNFRRRLQRELAALAALPVFAGKLPKGLRVDAFDINPREDVLGCWAPTRNTIRVRRCAPDLARLVLMHELCHVLAGGEVPVETDDGEVCWTSHGPAFQAVWGSAVRERYPAGAPDCVGAIA